MTIAFIISVLVILLLLVTLIGEWDKVKELKLDADTYKTIAEVAEKNGADLAKKLEDETSNTVIIHAEYETTQKDREHFITYPQIQNHAKRKLADKIAKEIFKKFDASVLPLDDGKEKYSIAFKIKRLCS